VWVLADKREWVNAGVSCSAHASTFPPARLQMEKRFPNKDTPLLVGCSDGTTYAIDALEMLDGAGYTTLVGLKG